MSDQTEPESLAAPDQGHPCPPSEEEIREAEEQAARRPDLRQPAYDAVYAYIRSSNRVPGDVVTRNAMIWNGVHAALDAANVGRCISSHCVEGDHVLVVDEPLTCVHPEGYEGECPCPPKCGCCTVAAPAPDPAPAPELRDQIAAALREHGMVHLGDQVPADEYDCCADAVLAVPAIQQLQAEAKRAERAERLKAELAEESRRRGKNILEYGEFLRARERELDGVRAQLGAEIVRAEQAEAAVAAEEETSRRLMQQRQQMAAERYARQERAERAEAAVARVKRLAANWRLGHHEGDLSVAWDEAAIALLAVLDNPNVTHQELGFDCPATVRHTPLDPQEMP